MAGAIAPAICFLVEAILRIVARLRIMISPMFRILVRSLSAVVVIAAFCAGQNAEQTATSSSSAEQAIGLADTGNCARAIPMLRKAIRTTGASDAKKKAGLAGLRCAMTHNQPYEAVEFLQVLSRDFPRDPEVLYQATHAYSDLSIRASQDLLQAAPSSYQVHELNAESLETQGKWEEAAAEYRKILANNPQLPGIHYRLGRLLLSKPSPGPEVAEEAKKNFAEELKIDPRNAGAEYVLGELERQDNNWPEAVAHFSRAAKLDSSFAEAYLGLGISLISEKQFSEAISPLQTAVQLEPRNPVSHYNLAVALNRSGRKDEAEREFAIHRKMQESAPSQGSASPR
jgi:tetratricopeptide (TPR) repeat protein